MAIGFFVLMPSYPENYQSQVNDANSDLAGFTEIQDLKSQGRNLGQRKLNKVFYFGPRPWMADVKQISL